MIRADQAGKTSVRTGETSVVNRREQRRPLAGLPPDFAIDEMRLADATASSGYGSTTTDEAHQEQHECYN